jgi:hypothetical protein
MKGTITNFENITILDKRYETSGLLKCVQSSIKFYDDGEGFTTGSAKITALFQGKIRVLRVGEKSEKNYQESLQEGDSKKEVEIVKNMKCFPIRNFR